MGVVEAKIQTVDDIYRLIWTATSHKQPMRAMYKDLPRLFCPHRLGRNRAGELRVLCYQYGGESESGLNQWVRRQTGAASYWKGSVQWNCWMALGDPRRTIRVRPVA
jgi:hypothetical protein